MSLDIRAQLVRITGEHRLGVVVPAVDDVRARESDARVGEHDAVELCRPYDARLGERGAHRAR